MDGFERKSDSLRDRGNYVISERIKTNHNNGLHKEFYFWRTYDGQEIDLIEECPESLSAIEFKWGSKHPSVPIAFSKAYPQASFEVMSRENYLNYI